MPMEWPKKEPKEVQESKSKEASEKDPEKELADRLLKINP